MKDEQLSALMDDELPGEATREAVSELLAAPQARATWGRYHLIGDALRAAAEQSTLVAESRPAADNVVPFAKPERKPVSRAGLGFAAAAALAAVAFIVPHSATHSGNAANGIAMNRSLERQNVSAQQRAAVDDALNDDGTGTAMDTTTVSQTDTVREDEAQKRMNTYLINFNEQRARQRTPGVHPYVRIVGYDTP
jgi:sigma-E factor negative regulatory protein RseA